MAGEYTVEVIGRGLAEFFAARGAGASARRGPELARARPMRRRQAVADAAGATAARAAAAVLHRLSRAAGVRGAEARAAGHRAGPHRGRHRLPPFATFEPFSMGHSILGYGMSLASRAGVSPMMRAAHAGGDGRRRLLAQRPADRRAVGAVQRRRRGAADPQERLHVGHRHAGDHLVAERRAEGRRARPAGERRARATGRSSARSPASASSGCARSTATTWRRCGATLDEAFTTDFAGLKVIIAEGECQLERQRRVQAVARGAAARRASASCASSTASTRTRAPATTPASASPAARR